MSKIPSNLDRHAVMKLLHPDGGSGMAAGVPEHLDEQVRRAVDHIWHVSELLGAVDHAEQFDDAAHAPELAQLVL